MAISDSYVHRASHNLSHENTAPGPIFRLSYVSNALSHPLPRHHVHSVTAAAKTKCSRKLLAFVPGEHVIAPGPTLTEKSFRFFYCNKYQGAHERLNECRFGLCTFACIRWAIPEPASNKSANKLSVRMCGGGEAVSKEHNLTIATKGRRRSAVMSTTPSLYSKWQQTTPVTTIAVR